MEPPEPIDPNFRIEVGTFEGPLDLLLHLIQKHELDILDLPIAFVTEKYVTYIGMMRELDLDVASEYLVMAATLAHIKSKMLLPQMPEDQETEPEEEIDPREELIRRLLEYQKYKLAAEGLGERPIAGRDVFVRGASEPVHEGLAPLAPIGLFKLLDAFEKLLEKTDDPNTLEITAERISIQERMADLIDTLREKRRVVFEELFGGLMTRYDLVVTFLATLEMVKLKLVRIYQTDPHSALHLEYRVLDATQRDLESAPQNEVVLPSIEPPTVELPTVETPTVETPTGELPTDETNVELPTDETNVETPTDETPTGETTVELPTGETTVELPTDETNIELPTDETPTGETTVELPTDETPTGELPTDETNVEPPSVELPNAELPSVEPAAPPSAVAPSDPESVT